MGLSFVCYDRSRSFLCAVSCIVFVHKNKQAIPLKPLTVVYMAVCSVNEKNSEVTKGFFSFSIPIVISELDSKIPVRRLL